METNTTEALLKYQRLFESAQDGILIVNFDSGLIEEVNPYLCQILGYKKEDFIGKQLWEIGAIVNKIEALEVFNKLHNQGYVRYDNLPLQHHNGSTLPVEFVSNVYDVGAKKVIQCNIRDISERRIAENLNTTLRNDLEMQNWAVLAYAQAAIALLHAKSPEDLFNNVCKGIVSQKQYVVAWVGIAEADKNRTVRVAAIQGSARSYAENLKVSWSSHTATGEGPVGSSIRLGKSIVIKDSATDPSFAPWRERAKIYNIRSIVSTPIFDHDRTVGSLAVYSIVPNAFSEKEILIFENLATEIGYGLTSIDNQNQLKLEVIKQNIAQEKLAAALNSTIDAMSKTMEWRDPYTAGHQRRVANIAREIGKKLGLDENQLLGLHMAGMVHDIGKVAIPSEILTKPTALTTIEIQMVREHVEAGYQILKDIPFPWPIAEIVRQHHERLNGSGYPHGLIGDQILLEAKILAVADTVEAMATHRPYRPARPLELTLSELKAQAGIGFDPTIVNVALEIFSDPSMTKTLLSY